MTTLANALIDRIAARLRDHEAARTMVAKQLTGSLLVEELREVLPALRLAVATPANANTSAEEVHVRR